MAKNMSIFVYRQWYYSYKVTSINRYVFLNRFERKQVRISVTYLLYVCTKITNVNHLVFFLNLYENLFEND